MNVCDGGWGKKLTKKQRNNTPKVRNLNTTLDKNVSYTDSRRLRAKVETFNTNTKTKNIVCMDTTRSNFKI
jgi:hypothetical protein